MSRTSFYSRLVLGTVALTAVLLGTACGDAIAPTNGTGLDGRRPQPPGVLVAANSSRTKHREYPAFRCRYAPDEHGGVSTARWASGQAPNPF
jgi:hypothetical protein